jgi:uncharacterized protein YigA (DUF484 family)
VSHKPEDDRPENGPELTADAVAEYLKAHPEFLGEHMEVIGSLVPPALDAGENVLDLQQFMLEKLQSEVKRLGGHWDELIATSRSNMAGQSQIHAAVLSMLEAETLEHLVHTVTGHFTDILNVDAVSLCFEGSAALVGNESDVRLLSPGDVDQLIGPERDIILRVDGDSLEEIFGPAAPLVQSDALLRIDVGAEDPAVLLALGSREADKFHPGQGTELLGFLAQALGRCLFGWLQLD